MPPLLLQPPPNSQPLLPALPMEMVSNPVFAISELLKRQLTVLKGFFSSALGEGLELL